MILPMLDADTREEVLNHISNLAFARKVIASNDEPMRPHHYPPRYPANDNWQTPRKRSVRR